MTDVLIRYNPYTVKTTLSVNGTEINSGSPLFYVSEQRLQSWIEPHGHWHGIFPELKKQTGEKQIQIRFHGTAYDFADLEYARKQYGDVFERVELSHINKDTCMRGGQDDKIKQLKELYRELQNGPIEEFKTDEIRKAFTSAINDEFKIVVVAPMSSGKSTLINAILGCDLLPALAEATTAVITEIRDNDDMSTFQVSAKDADDQPICFKVNEDGSFVEQAINEKEKRYIPDPEGRPVSNMPANSELIRQLNAAIDPDDPQGKKALIQTIQIEGPIPAFSTSRLKTVFVDTPGGSYALNEEHRRLMEDAIQDEEKSLILFIFNGTQTGTNDSVEILSMIAEEMKKSSNGKQSRDRFLFVANRMDDFDAEEEPFDRYVNEAILPELASHGIQGPNLFLTSAQLAKLLRMRRANESLTKKDRAFLAGMLPLFGDLSDGDKSYCLYQYSAITNLQKEEFDQQIRSLASGSGDTEGTIAEINSGIPALEASIQDYVEKYAVSIKIKNAHDTFMRKVKARKMVGQREAMWVSSKATLDAVRAEISEKRKAYQSDKDLAAFREKIDRIRIDKKLLLDFEANLRQEIDKISVGKKNMRKDKAQQTLEKFRNQLETQLRIAGEKAVSLLNTSVLKPCSEIIKAYTDYVKSLDDKGFLDLGGIKVRELDGFEELSIDDADEMLEDERYTFEERVKAGTRRYERSGFFNALKRLFGVKDGWGVEDVYEDVEYIRVPELVEEKINAYMELFHEELMRCIKKVESQVEDVKKSTYKRLDRIDKRMERVLRELEEKVSDEERLIQEVKANEQNLQWMKDFINRVDSILEIE